MPPPTFATKSHQTPSTIINIIINVTNNKSNTLLATKLGARPSNLAQWELIATKPMICPLQPLPLNQNQHPPASPKISLDVLMSFLPQSNYASINPQIPQEINIILISILAYKLNLKLKLLMDVLNAIANKSDYTISLKESVLHQNQKLKK